MKCSILKQYSVLLSYIAHLTLNGSFKYKFKASINSSLVQSLRFVFFAFKHNYNPTPYNFPKEVKLGLENI